MPKLSPELLKYLPGGLASKCNASNVFEEDEDKPLSDTGTLTKADAILIAQTIKEELQSGIFERYRKNSLTFTPPIPKETSSDAYTRLYSKMLKSSFALSDELRIKLWILLDLEKNDSSIKDISLREVSEKIDTIFEEWESRADKKGFTLTQFVNEEHSYHSV